MAGVIQEIDLVIAQQAKAKAIADAEAAGRQIGTAIVSGSQSGVERLMGMVKAIGGALAVAFGVREIIRFGQASLKAADESDRAWNDLTQTLKIHGVQISQVRGEVERLGASLLKNTRFSDEAGVRALNQLVQMTGDYRKSLAAVSVAADLAAAKHMSLEEASLLVGKALNGQTTALIRQGIVLDKHKDILVQLRAQFAGMAANELNTVGGRLQQLANLWDEVKEAIGHALIEGGHGTTVFSTMASTLRGLATWVTENRTQLVRVVNSMLGLVEAVNRQVLPALDGLANQLRLLEPAWDQLRAKGLLYLAFLQELAAVTATSTGNFFLAAEMHKAAAANRDLAKSLQELADAKRADIATARIPDPNALTTSHGGPSTVPRGTRGVTGIPGPTEEELKALADKQKALYNDLLNAVAKGSNDAGAEVQRTIDQLKEKYLELGKHLTPALKAAYGQAINALEIQLRDATLKARDAMTEELQGQLISFTATGVDDLEAEIQKLQVKIIQTFGSVPAEAQKVLDGFREKLRNLKFTEGIQPEIDAFIKKAKEARDAFGQGLTSPLLALAPQSDDLLAKLTAQLDTLDKQGAEYKKILDLIKEIKEAQTGALADVGNANVTLDDTVKKTATWGEAMATVAQGMLDIGNGLGIVDSKTAKVLQGFIAIGKNLPKALSGDPAAIIGTIGGFISTVGGLIGKSPEEMERIRVNKANTEAILKLTHEIGNIQINITGQGMSKLQEVFAKLSDPNNLVKGNFGEIVQSIGPGSDNTGVGDRVKAALAAEGLNLDDLKAAAAELHLTFENTSQFYRDFAEALKKVEFNKFTEDFAGQMDMLNRLWAISGDVLPTEQLRQWINMMGHLSTALAAEFDNINMDNKADLEAARAKLVEDARRFTTLTEDEAIAVAGALTPTEYLDSLQKGVNLLDAALDKIAQDAADAEQRLRDDQAANQANYEKRRDDQLAKEQGMVDRRIAAEEAQDLKALRERGKAVGGQAQAAIEDAARQVAAALKLAQSGEFGAGPLAEDAMRRARAAQSASEQLIQQAEQARNLIGNGTLTAGFQVTRTITEASSGRVVGELTTIVILHKQGNALLTEIRDRVGNGAGGGSAVLADRYSNQALLAGIGEMPS